MPFVPPSLLVTIGSGILIVLVGGYRKLDEIQTCQNAQGTAMLIILRDNETDVPNEIESNLRPSD